MTFQRKLQRMIVCIATAALVVAGLTSTAWGQEEKKDGWHDKAEFSFVATGGNAESQSLGFKNKLSREWDRSSFVLRAGGIRVETTATFRSAQIVDVNDPASGVIQSSSDETTTTAENYFFNGRYERKVTDRFFWYAGAGWDRNRFAGIQNRYSAVGGVGNTWIDRDDLKFKTDYAVTYTDQEDVFDNPAVDDSFLGLRFSWDYFNKISETVDYENFLVLDENLDETSDWRADMINSLSVAMSERMALKVGLQLLYDNEPSFFGVVVDPDDSLGNPVPTPLPVELFQLDELDTIFTVSLVVNF